jgi:threonine dehydrogenase-like Zn-dependent dehydrogenase
VLQDLQIVFTEKEQAALRTADFDDQPGDNEIVGRNVISLISTGSERGGFTQQFPAGSYPMQSGSSSIAVVLLTGPGVTSYKEGDLFFHDHHHTLYVKEREDNTIAVPAGLPVEQAIFGRYAAVSWTSVYRMRAKPVDTVLVTGLGLVGLMAAQVCNALGYTVYAVDPLAERRDIAALTTLRNIGADVEQWPHLQKRIGGMLECSGNEEALRRALPYMRPNSDIFQVGVPWHKCSDWDAHSLLYDLFYSYVSLHGGWEWFLPKKSTEFEVHASYYHVRSAMELIAAGKIRIVPEMYQLRDPHDCDQVYKDITKPTAAPTCMIFNWRSV